MRTPSLSSAIQFLDRSGFLVYEWKANRKGTAEIAEAVRAGLAYVLDNPLFKAVEKFNRERLTSSLILAGTLSHPTT